MAWAKLDDQCGGCSGANFAQGCNEAIGTAGNQKLIFGPDDEVEVAENILKRTSDVGAGNVARFPVAW